MRLVKFKEFSVLVFTPYCIYPGIWFYYLDILANSSDAVLDFSPIQTIKRKMLGNKQGIKS